MGIVEILLVAAMLAILLGLVRGISGASGEVTGCGCSCSRSQVPDDESDAAREDDDGGCCSAEIQQEKQ